MSAGYLTIGLDYEDEKQAKAGQLVNDFRQTLLELNKKLNESFSAG